MIETLFNSPRILHQAPDAADEMPEAPVAACIDANGMIILSQEGRQICLNRSSIRELRGLLENLSRL